MIAGPWAWHFRGRGSNGPDAQDFAASSHLPLEAFPFYLGRLGLALGIALALLFCVGLAARLGKRSARRGVWAALAGLIAAGVLFHSLANGGLEERHLVFVLPAAITFAVAGAVVVQEWLSLRWSRAAIAGFPAVSVVLLLVAIISQEIITRALNLSPSKHWSGYGKLANELLSDAHGKEQAIMISSDPTGEGVFTAELAMREKRPGHIVKLASRDLARRDTLRGDPRPRFETEDDVATWFAKAGIDYLLIDESVPEELRTQHHDQLMRAVDAHSDRFWPMARQIITRDGQIHSSRTTLYRVKHVE